MIQFDGFVEHEVDEGQTCHASWNKISPKEPKVAILNKEILNCTDKVHIALISLNKQLQQLKVKIYTYTRVENHTPQHCSSEYTLLTSKKLLRSLTKSIPKRMILHNMSIEKEKNT